jgi:hypothetical protein
MWQLRITAENENQENYHPKLRNLIINHCLILIILSSCNRKYDFGYNEDKSGYMANVDCLRKNYSKIFNPLSPRSPIYFSPTSVTKHAVCGELFLVMQRHGIAYVSFEKDSTVAFYSLPKGMTSKQFILVLITARVNIQDKIKKDIKLIEKIDSNCYELEKAN